MKLGIDVREAYQNKRTGKGQWVKGLLDALRRRDCELTLLATDDQSVTDAVTFPAGWSWHKRATQYVQSVDLDAYLSPTSFIVPALLKDTVPTVPVVHDLIAFRHEPHDWKAMVIERLYLGWALERAAHVCAVSAATKVDLTQRFSYPSDRITVTHAGPMQAEVTPNTPDQQTILCIGTLCPRKNQLRLIRAYAALPQALKDQYCLQLVGARGWHDRSIVRAAAQTPGVTWRDYVSDDEYQQLLATCTIFAFPSLYEGFGMAVLDALQRGIPVLTADRGSLHEVVGSAALLVNPDDQQSITAGLTRLLCDDELRSSLAKQGLAQAAQFTWEKTADCVLAACERAILRT